MRDSSVMTSILNREVTRSSRLSHSIVFFFQAEDGIRDYKVTGVQTCALPISHRQGAQLGRALAPRRLLLRPRRIERPRARRREDRLRGAAQARLLLGGGCEDQIGRASCRERV